MPKGSFIPDKFSAPDYHQQKYWAALPGVKDSADAVPLSTWQDEQATSPVDVFFIHPTTYTGKRGEKEWNADVDSDEINLRTDKYPIRYQASIFNGAGRVYAPRYRQAHLNCFYTLEKKKEASEALELAYNDVLKAFRYYLDHYNEGRPFIIASHSQGTFHAGRLLKDIIEGSPLADRMVVAYIPGLPVPAHYFKEIKPCTQPDQINCFCSWRTVREGAEVPKLRQRGKEIIVTNPVTWDATAMSSSEAEHQGAILRDFRTLWPDMFATIIHDDLLWVSKPRFPGSFLLMTKNYHIADYNFFYADIRFNAQRRVRAYLENH